MRSPPTSEPANSPAMSEAAGGTVTWGELWTETTARLGRPQARWVCEVASGFEGDEFLEILDRPAGQRGVAHLDAMLQRLATGEPLQYVLGRWSFRHLDLMVDRRVLIPRPETESVVEAALHLIRSAPMPVICADLGTGSGAIGLSLAAELPVDGVTIWMTDVSDEVLDVARANATGIGRAASNVRLAAGPWYDALPAELVGRLDVIVSNPPYVAVDDPQLEPAVREWEPELALVAGPEGLDAIRRLVEGAPAWLRPGGWLVLEIGSMQGDAVRQLLADAGLEAIEIKTDATGRDRIAIGRRGGS
ncbi:MAG TPA: peptide chain release factor N(5)-glutamine methyltransferase [Ilumatobacteraceae bacterium]|nr:peptide chain release factor N(5)-glutamine methyltransferase [Ilumatobacteraceae bacterium]